MGFGSRPRLVGPSQILKRDAMTFKISWTNPSVLQFSANRNPIDTIESRIRSLSLQAMDNGWLGPPFDPVELARILKIPIEARGDIPDARTVSRNESLVIEYNPLRPRARVRFSIAHEITHSLFPDCAEAVRNRGGDSKQGADNWQLEMLCNIGAAELLMPAGELPDFDSHDLTISNLLELRKRFDVSTEAILIRSAKHANIPCAAFCASRHEGKYQIDYIIPSRGWVPGISIGTKLPEDSLVADANAIGFTSIGNEKWSDGDDLHIECIALSPYPGALIPRVVGILYPVIPTNFSNIAITEVVGDALSPRGRGAHIIAHIVPNSSSAWGGWGFAGQVKKRFPETWTAYRNSVDLIGLPLEMGKCIKSELPNGNWLFNMVSQYGVGRSKTPRIRYAALETCLRQLAEWAQELDASVHMPRIGTGHAGGDWTLIKDLVLDLLVKQDIDVTIYTPPPCLLSKNI